MTKKTSVFSNALIWFGAGVSIAEILTGTYFAPLGMAKGFLAIVVGHVIGCAMMLLAGLIGGYTGRSAMETVKMSFGRKALRHAQRCKIGACQNFRNGNARTEPDQRVGGGGSFFGNAYRVTHGPAPFSTRGQGQRRGPWGRSRGPGPAWRPVRRKCTPWRGERILPARTPWPGWR